MKIETYIDSLVAYAMNTHLAEPCDHIMLTNKLLEALHLDDYAPSDELLCDDLEEILEGILDYAARKGLCGETITERDLFDTKIMGLLTPMPREVIRIFREKYAVSPREATDWYYRFSQDSNYIRAQRVAKDMRWKLDTPYGELDITINLSKPEKDPKAIAAAKNAPQSGYPKCQLCPENEGYAGRMNHPARQNHRVIPITVMGEPWCLQYSPYVYYNEHCIVFNSKHIPMKIDRAAFEKLLDFTTAFPHYFVGSNADLPIVGGSILAHEHFQGGHYRFAMEKASIRETVHFAGYDDITAGIVHWPMSDIRLRGNDKARIAQLGEKILNAWIGYSDERVGVVAFTDSVRHNTVTPIARRRGEAYELDLVLRCNITTEQCPLGLFHPHADKHHIKKENIGLIEVMGLAVLPSRLKKELAALADALVTGADIAADEMLSKHADWARELQTQYVFTRENAMEILQRETGKVFAGCLEDAGVFKNDAGGQEAMRRFIRAVNA